MLVDTGSPGEGKKIIRELRKLGVELSDLSLILHTHGHSDHCGSTAELISYHKIPTAIHSGDQKMIETGKNGLIKTDLLMGGYLGGALFPHLPHYHYFIDNLEEVHQSIRKILEFQSEKFYVGHGGPLTKAKTEKRFSLIKK